MENDNTEKVSPSIVWTQCFDLLSTYARQMKNQYTKRMRENCHFTWDEVNTVVNKIHNDLDFICTLENKNG